MLQTVAIKQIVDHTADFLQVRKTKGYLREGKGRKDPQVGLRAIYFRTGQVLICRVTMWGAKVGSASHDGCVMLSTLILIIQRASAAGAVASQLNVVPLRAVNVIRSASPI